MGAVTYPTLEHVAMEARPYPTQVLEGAESGLVLFAAAFLGHNDAIHMAEAGLRCVWCVDTDAERLSEMEVLYPDNWFFLNEDAWHYASTAKERYHGLGHWQPWDVVSLDPYTGDMMAQVIASRDLWCSIAKKAVVMGVPPDIGYVGFPEGWKVTGLVERSHIAAWLVVERDADT